MSTSTTQPPANDDPMNSAQIPISITSVTFRGAGMKNTITASLTGPSNSPQVVVSPPGPVLPGVSQTVKVEGPANVPLQITFTLVNGGTFQPGVTYTLIGLFLNNDEDAMNTFPFQLTNPTPNPISISGVQSIWSMTIPGQSHALIDILKPYKGPYTLLFLDSSGYLYQFDPTVENNPS